MSDVAIAEQRQPLRIGTGLPGPGRPPQATLALLKNIRVNVARAMKHKFAVVDYEPILAIAEIGCDISNPVDIRLNAHKSICPYFYPQLKQVEVTGANGGPIEHKMSMADELIGMIVVGDLDLGKVIEGEIIDDKA